MMQYVMITIQALLAEVAGVAILAGILYVYWNTMTKKEN